MPAKMISGFFMVLILLQALVRMTSALAPQTHQPIHITAGSRASNDSSLVNKEEFKKKILDDQNWYRAQHGAVNLTWNDVLEVRSEEAKPCNPSRSIGVTVKIGGNFASGYNSVDEAVDDWGLARTSYDYEQPDSKSSKGSSFTQLVWNSTTQVGCVRTECDVGYEITKLRWNIICKYMPQGNIAGQFSQNVGRQVSGAPEQGIAKSLRNSGSSFNKGSGLLSVAIAFFIALCIQ